MMAQTHPLPSSISKLQLHLGSQDWVEKSFPSQQSTFQVKDLPCLHTYSHDSAPDNTVQVSAPWLGIDPCNGSVESLFCDRELIVIRWKPWEGGTVPSQVHHRLVLFPPKPPWEGGRGSNLPEHEKMLSARTKIKIFIVCLSKSSSLFPFQARIPRAHPSVFI